MKIEFISTDGAPKAIGPYSQAVIHGDLIFTAGQIALDPATMEIVPGGITEQTQRVLTNLEAVLQAAGSDLSRVLKTTVFLSDMNHFKEIHAVRRRYFKEPYPASTMVEVSRLVSPEHLIEIEATAFIELKRSPKRRRAGGARGRRSTRRAR